MDYHGSGKGSNVNQLCDKNNNGLSGENDSSEETKASVERVNGEQKQSTSENPIKKLLAWIISNLKSLWLGALLVALILEVISWGLRVNSNIDTLKERVSNYHDFYEKHMEDYKDLLDQQKEDHDKVVTSGTQYEDILDSIEDMEEDLDSIQAVLMAPKGQ